MTELHKENIFYIFAYFTNLDDAGMLGPRKLDGGMPEPNFLKPAQGSILIDAGIDVGISFEGSAPDIRSYFIRG